MTDLEQHHRVERGSRAADLKLAFSPARIRAWLGERLRMRPSLRFNPWILFDRRRPLLRRLTIATLALVAVVAIGSGALWWRLASGPISLDLATPWLTAAIEENLNGRYPRVSGTGQARAGPHCGAAATSWCATTANWSVAPKAESGSPAPACWWRGRRAAVSRLVDVASSSASAPMAALTSSPAAGI